MSFIFCSIAYSQDVLSVDEMNSIYRKDHHVNKKVNKYSPLRQADVMWSRKIWREIDMREKINHPCVFCLINYDQIRFVDIKLQEGMPLSCSQVVCKAGRICYVCFGHSKFVYNYCFYFS